MKKPIIGQFLLRALLRFSNLLLCFFPAYADVLLSDTTALLALRAALAGQPLLWNLSTTPCSWEGVACNQDRVIELRLPAKGLSGHLPGNTLGNLTQLQTLSLRSNTLSGSLPPDIANLRNIVNLFLQENSFSGDIPESLFSLQSLVRLDLFENNFTGKISKNFNNLTRLVELNLQKNQLTGSIPGLNLKLDRFNVSFNRLRGRIPSSLAGFPASAFEGNSLCGKPLLIPCKGGKRLSTGAVVGIVVGCIVFLVLVGIVLAFFCYRVWFVNNQLESHPKEVARRKLVFVRKHPEWLFTLEDLLSASAEVLGMGTFGTTYKASLGVGIIVTVKRLRNVNVSEDEFKRKMEELGAMEHENLVPLRAYYYDNKDKLLVYDYIPMGSLSAVLHGQNVETGRIPIDWETRCRIALGAAKAIAYLHSQGPETSHGNIKSSNVLLTRSHTAQVSHFGLAHLAGPITTPNHLHGYLAPEVLEANHRITQKADVYSFGVLLLELLTGKAPGNSSLWNEDGLDLPGWVQSMIKQVMIDDIFEEELWKYQDNHESMKRLLEVALECIAQGPDQRPSMSDVAQRIEACYQSISAL